MSAAGVNAKTEIYAILGDPIRHSLSPVIMNRMFARLGMDKVFLAFQANRENAVAVFQALNLLDLQGYVLTMPVKEILSGRLDGLEAEAGLTGAVNCVVRRGNRLIGHNTDSPGFWNAVLEKSGGRPPKSLFVLGAGGFAKAAVCQAVMRGAGRLTIVSRFYESGVIDGFRRFMEQLAGRFPNASLTLEDWRPEEWKDRLAAVDLVVNATPNGMGGGGDLRQSFPFESVKPDALFFDAIYNPLETDFLRRARELGHAAANGLDLLAHQGAVSFKLWTGAEPDPAVMREDALAFLAGRPVGHGPLGNGGAP